MQLACHAGWAMIKRWSSMTDSFSSVSKCSSEEGAPVLYLFQSLKAPIAALVGDLIPIPQTHKETA